MARDGQNESHGPPVARIGDGQADKISVDQSRAHEAQKAIEPRRRKEDRAHGSQSESETPVSDKKDERREHKGPSVGDKVGRAPPGPTLAARLDSRECRSPDFEPDREETPGKSLEPKGPSAPTGRQDRERHGYEFYENAEPHFFVFYRFFWLG